MGVVCVGVERLCVAFGGEDGGRGGAAEWCPSVLGRVGVCGALVRHESSPQCSAALSYAEVN